MQMTREHLNGAASVGVINAPQADALWNYLTEQTKHRPRFDAIHVTYYAGALLVIGAMGWFMTTAWETLGGGGIFTIASAYALLFIGAARKLSLHHGMPVPAGLLATMAVAMTPLALYGLQRALGLWGFDDPGMYKDFHRWVRGGWFTMEAGTILAGLAALRYFRYPFLTAPIAVALWYLSMDLTPIITSGEPFSWEMRKLVSLWFGLAMIALGYVVDLKAKGDYAFWLYLFGLLAFWGGLSAMNSHSEWSKFGYGMINLGLVVAAVFLRRKVFLVFGALGMTGYLGHLAFRLFEDSILFPFVLSAAGLGVFATGIVLKRWSQRHEDWFGSDILGPLKRLRPPQA